MMSETIQVIRFAESAARACRLQKKTMNLCACEREHGVHRRKIIKWKRTNKKTFSSS